ncbi:hypothetical protein CLV58_13640 [Spirosoma oryzae]|uniref:Uncharacterized protein n=1 Tax=Spirosoma oryzae TaxID=1469603 RepID=A0A2T0RXJ2_9BACT|nr:hypothetical protein [Spirosoma oryzae]PRY25905.1 hypothetical protein CLV58_13640 [Spirosoma oryzae]
MDLTKIDALLNATYFYADSTDDQPWRDTFVALIEQVDSLLTLLDQRGQRVDFTQGVGVHGKIQDITSLVHWLHKTLALIAEDGPRAVSQHRINRYFNEGWGRFANGYRLANEFEGDLAFFVDDQRIYLEHHLRRAVDQARHLVTG